MRSRGLAVAASVLLVATTVVAVAGAISAGRPVMGVLLGASFLGIYAVGMVRAVRAHADFEAIAPGSRHGRNTIAWVLALTVIWIGLLAVSETALWLAFPLIMLQVGVLGVLWGSIATVLTGLVTVGISVARIPADQPIGGAILGPLLGSSIALVITWAGMAVITESASLKHANDELRAARDALARAEKEQILARERSRMAGEIHDTVSQDLSGIAMLLRVAEQSDDLELIRQLLAQSLVATQDALVDARRVTKALAPRELTQKRLTAALAGLAKEPVLADLDIDVIEEGEGPELSLGEEAALLRVAKSALVNVKEHSGVKHATVYLFRDEGGATLEVRDEGRGIKDAPVPEGRGFGIPSMRARLAEVGGSLEIESSDAGTTVRAKTGGTA